MWPEWLQLDQEIVLEAGAQLHRLKMFPYFDIAHYILMIIEVRDDLGTNASLFSRKHPLSCWLSSMLMCFADAFLANFLLGEPVVAPFKRHDDIILATIVWYLVFYAPFDGIYKLAKVLPIKCVLAVLKEVKRAYKVTHGVSHAAKLYPNSYMVQVLVGTAKGAGSGIIRTIEQLVRGVWLPNHNEVLRPSFATKACVFAAAIFALEKNSVYISAPHDIVYLCIVGFFIYFKLSAVIFEVTDPLAPVENLFCAVFMGGIWDAFSRQMVEDKRSDIVQKCGLNNVSVNEVNQDNLPIMWPSIFKSMSTAEAIGIDLEFSGLGERHSLNAPNIEDRYAAIRQAALTRSVMSIGLAFFIRNQRAGDEEHRMLRYKCRVFNLLTLSHETFSVEPEALKFLGRHSFDFNRWLRSAIQYTPSSSKSSDKEANHSLRQLFTEIFASKSAIFTHNGLMDIAFIYHHFYAPLPDSFSVWCSALCDIFPTDSPLCDSKILAEYDSRMTASFLEFVFRKCQRDNVVEALGGRWHLRVKISPIEKASSSDNGYGQTEKDSNDKVNCSLPEGFPEHFVPSDVSQRVCGQFGNHGFCRKRDKGLCTLVHDVDWVLDAEEAKRSKTRQKRKRRFQHLMPQIEKPVEEEKKPVEIVASTSEHKVTEKERIAVAGCHRAGFDAFMTGFAGLYQSRLCLKNGQQQFNPEMINRLPLSGKPRPLQLLKSQFSTDCAIHKERFWKIQRCREKLIGKDTVDETLDVEIIKNNQDKKVEEQLHI